MAKKVKKPGKPKKEPDDFQNAWEIAGAAIGQPLSRKKSMTFRPKSQMYSRKKTTSSKSARIRPK